MEIESDSSDLIEQELTELDQNPLQEDPDAVESVESVPIPKRGRPAIPDQWSQVMSLDGGRELRMKSYLVSTDLLLL